MRIESESRLATVGFVLVAICLGVVQFSIFLAQTTFALAAILWLIVTIQERRRPDLPAFFLPLVVYAGLTLVSAAMSPNAQKSFIDSRQLLLWLMVPVSSRVRPRREESPNSSVAAKDMRFAAARRTRSSGFAFFP